MIRELKTAVDDWPPEVKAAIAIELQRCVNFMNLLLTEARRCDQTLTTLALPENESAKANGSFVIAYREQVLYRTFLRSIIDLPAALRQERDLTTP